MKNKEKKNAYVIEIRKREREQSGKMILNVGRGK